MTERQKQLLDFIRGYIESHGGVAPTLCEMRDALGKESTSTVSALLDGLHSQGLIERRARKHRGISIPAEPGTAVDRLAAAIRHFESFNGTAKTAAALRLWTVEYDRKLTAGASAAAPSAGHSKPSGASS